ncbi:MAG: glycosyltransferase family 4 protein [Aquificaceae bacterium]
MKIVWLNGNPNPNFGGTEIHTVQMVKELQREGVDIVLVVARDSYVDLHTKGVRKYYISFPNSLALLSTYRLMHVLKEEKPDFLVANNGKEYANALISAKLSGTRVVFFRHMERMKEWIVRNFVFPYVDFFFAVSYQVEKNLIKEGVDPKKIKVIYNTVDEERFFWKEKPKNSVNFLFVGKLDEGKGVFDLLEAFLILLKEKDSLRCFFVGDGKMRKKLEDIVKERSLEDKVLFTGYVQDVERYYQASHVCVIPSKETEAISRVALEALSCGCAIVASDVGGIKEAVVEGYNGCIFKGGDVKDLYEKMLITLENWETFSKNSLYLFKERFLRDKVIGDFVSTLGIIQA